VLDEDAAVRLLTTLIVCVVQQAVNVGAEDLSLELKRKSVPVRHFAFWHRIEVASLSAQGSAYMVLFIPDQISKEAA